MGGSSEHTLIQAVLKDLEGGFFRLDPQKRFVYLDARAKKMLQVQEGASWSQVCFHQQASQSLLEQARRGDRKQPVVGTLLLHYYYNEPDREKKRKIPFWARVYVTAEYDASGTFQGWHGYLRDVSAEEVRQRLERLPVGFYVLQRDSEDRERIVYASPGFAELYRCESPKAMLGRDIQEFFRSEVEYKDFLNFLREQGESAGEYSLLGWKNEVSDPQGHSLHVTADMSWLVDEHSRIVERWGILRDVKKDRFLTSRVHDYAVVLHTYSSALIGVRHALDALKALMIPDPFANKRGELGDKVLGKRLDNLAHKLRDTLTAVVKQAHERQLQADEIARFEEYIERLEHISQVQLAWRLATYIDLGARILHHVQSLRSQRSQAQKPWFKRELLRQLRVKAWDLARISSLAVIYQSETQVLEVDQEVQAFRDFWTQPFRECKQDLVDLVRVLNAAMIGLEEYAHARGVRWRRYGSWPEHAWVQGDERRLRRAFGHLLHNAVKYSWQRARGTWVGIRIQAEQEEDQPIWRVYIENYGVAIDENEMDSIFQFGYRGRHSHDRSRPGTGIGLYDARQVFESHGGKLKLDSRPASSLDLDKRSSPDQPYLTTATVDLPKAKLEGGDPDAG